MAWEHIKAAFDYTGDVGETALHVLLRIAFEMRGNDYAFPGTEYLARKMNCSRKTIQRAVNELSAAGAIRICSGRFSGHRNHYYLTIPGLPPPAIEGGTKRDLSTIRPVDNSPRCPVQRAGVGQNGPQEVGQISPDIGQNRPEGWDKNDAGKRNIKSNQESGYPMRLAQNDPPVPSDRRLPPIGTIEFKSFAIHFCHEAGASLELARRFYEQHQADNWAVLDHMPLEAAAQHFVAEWKRADPRAWHAEQFSRMKEAKS